MGSTFIPLLDKFRWGCRSTLCWGRSCIFGSNGRANRGVVRQPASQSVRVVGGTNENNFYSFGNWRRRTVLASKFYLPNSYIVFGITTASAKYCEIPIDFFSIIQIAWSPPRTIRWIRWSSPQGATAGRVQINGGPVRQLCMEYIHGLYGCAWGDVCGFATA